jgi:hypothetical protein
MSEIKTTTSALTPSKTPLLDKDQAASVVRASINKPKRATAPKRRSLSDADNNGTKMFAWGYSGEGKTFTLVGFLKAGLKVYVIETDIGGSGINAVKNELKRLGREDLFANIFALELPTYDDVAEFLIEPANVDPDIYDLDIDMLVWDGFTGFQQGQLDEHVMSLAPAGDKVGELRDAGLFANQQDWGGIKRGTLTNMNRALYLNNRKTGKLWHKFVTALADSKSQEYGAAGEREFGPLLQGAAKKMIEPAFDLIWQCVKKIDAKGATYTYDFGSKPNMLAKQRGYGLETILPADSEALWRRISSVVEVAA